MSKDTLEHQDEPNYKESNEERECVTLQWGFIPGHGWYGSGPPRRTHRDSLDYYQSIPNGYMGEYLRWLLDPGKAVFGNKPIQILKPILKLREPEAIWDYKCANSMSRNGQLFLTSGKFGVYEINKSKMITWKGTEPVMFEMPTSWWHTKKPPLTIQVWNIVRDNQNLTFNLFQTMTKKDHRTVPTIETVHLYSADPTFP
jgi:hypothetical protein